MAEKNKTIQITEEPITVYAEVTSIKANVQETATEVNVEAASLPFIEAEDIEMVEIEMEEAFPFVTTGALDTAMNDKDVLIDGGVALEKNDEVISLQELLDIAAGSGNVSHPLLHGRELSDQHPITAISGLREELDEIESIKRVYSSENGLGEFRKWHDGNPQGEDRSGYFVTIVPGTDDVEICDATKDVYGISVNHSGFVGNQNSSDKSDNYSYTIVGIVGAMRVRTDGTARNGEYVVPNAYGEATLSENEYGYKVLSQGSYPSYEYVTIGITPQSDALSRLQGSVASGDLGDIIIKIEDLEIKVDASNKDIEDILGELGDIAVQVTDAKDVATEAATNAEIAKDAANQAAAKAAQAQQDAQDVAAGAINSANEALSTASDLAAQMEPIITWKSEDGMYSGAGGFVNQSYDNHMILSSIVTGVGPEDSEIAAIFQKVDDNGVMIQHLVSNIDLYSIGDQSLSYGLSYEEVRSILTDKYIYVPTVEHTETLKDENGEVVATFNFEKDDYTYSYIWNPSEATWVKNDKAVSTATQYKSGEEDGDLWFCWQDVEVQDDNGEVVDTYKAGTLNKWWNGTWVEVATIADNHQARILTSIKQTSDEIEMSVVASGADGSTFKQKLDSIFTTVYDSDGYISSLEQTAESIRAGTYTDSGTASQLELLTSETNASLNAVASGRFHVVYHSYLGDAPDVYENGNKYTNPPVWDENTGVFVFNDIYADANGTYYFTSVDQTKYCKVTENGYEIYTIGNKATASLDNRISTTEAVLMGTAMLDTEDSSALSNITIAAREDESVISSVASYYYHSLISVSEEIIPVLSGQRKYNKPPVWNLGEGKYVFDIVDRDDNGTYYMIDEEAQTYCRVVTADDGTVLYETYGLGDQSTAYMLQKADANSAAIGMVVDHNGVKGSAIIEAINGQSLATINADKINLLASTKFQAIVDAGGNITPASIVAGINDSESSVKISADHVAITADDIDLSASNMFKAVVGTDGTITPASIVAAINESGSTVTIEADKINLNGYVTFTDLQSNTNTIINGNYIKTGTIDADYLSLYGITVKKKSDNTTSFAVSDTGEVTINGKVHMGAGSTISWSDIDESGSSAYSLASSANTTADNANTTAGIANANAIAANNNANTANANAISASDMARAIANGEYSGGTFFDGKIISSPTIYGGQIYWGDNAALGGLLRTTGSIIYGDGTMSATDLVHLWTTDGMYIQATGGGIRIGSTHGLWLEFLPNEIAIRTGNTSDPWMFLNEYVASMVPSTTTAVFG